ncbi:patatin-like phospholipase family protein [Gallibacterium anatis]|uniref:Serine protease n=2 Tax=Gallibacterium anatis TaxID=750 RepID=A0A0A2XGQ2_9PAST|nr:patatin-like phospholipase family protein [Gallibacterium anatis]ERF78693.1 serine protease [Gallibacterium anatis 12656/12]KGQ31333.1 serine protease [Gallibacterium anatis]OBW90923.1 serine protease [Gallibacterium anatis]OBW98417.1 serine protease [Gallibacterium anatis]OZN50105.1 patatin family protein [Gallibacterium anatis]
MKVGLVLEGGAMRGLYTAGILDVFLEQDIHVDGIVGVSAGVLFGVNYPSKQKGRALRYNLKYLNDKRYMGLHSLITTGNIVNKDFAFYDLPINIDRFDEQAFIDSGIDFYATLTNVDTGQAEYVKLSHIFEQMEVLRATSAMPFVSRMVEIDGKRYLDGGIADSIPLEKCRQLGYDKIIVILTRPLEYRKKAVNPLLFKLFYAKYPNLVTSLAQRYLNYNQRVEQVIEADKKGEIFVFRPSKTLPIKRIEKDPVKIQAMYDLGVADAHQALADLKHYLSH